MAQHVPPQWEAPQFTFNAEDQATEWQRFHIKAIDYLEALDIDPDQEDDTRREWKQIKMMFKGEDRQTLQTLGNNTITQEDQHIPSKSLQAIQTTIKEDEHFWHYRGEIFSDVRQQAHEGIHTLNTRITSLVNNCKFTDTPTKETVKFMLKSTTEVKFHKARDWIRLQDQSTLTYTSFFNHCIHLEQQCEQFQKVQLKGRAQLTTLGAATATQSSVHQDAITVHSTCHWCRHSHPKDKCPAYNQWCCNCNRIGHFSDLCRSRNTRYTNNYRESRSNWRRPRSSSRSSSAESIVSPHRDDRSHSRHRRRHRSPTPHHIDTIIIAEPSIASDSDTEDKPATFNKCKNRCPTPVPETLITFPTFSDTDEDQPYPRRRCPTPIPHICKTYTTESDSDTDSEMSIDEDHLSTDYNASTPPKTYHILLIPPRTHKMLPRSSMQTFNHQLKRQSQQWYQQVLNHSQPAIHHFYLHQWHQLDNT